MEQLLNNISNTVGLFEIEMAMCADCGIDAGRWLARQRTRWS